MSEQETKGMTPEPVTQPVETAASPQVFDEHYVKELRSEAAARRLENKELKAQLDAIKEQLGSLTGAKPDGDIGEVVKVLTGKVSAAEEAVRVTQERLMEAAQRTALVAAASRAGMANPDDAIALVSRELLKIDDSGMVAGADEAVAELVKAKPYLLASRQPPAIPPTNPAEGAQKDKLERLLDQKYGAVGNGWADMIAGMTRVRFPWEE